MDCYGSQTTFLKWSKIEIDGRIDRDRDRDKVIIYWQVI